MTRYVNTIFLENVPQLIVQAMYAYSIQSLTENVVAAFLASALSALAATLSYVIERDQGELTAIQYELILRCDADNDGVFEVSSEEDSAAAPEAAYVPKSPGVDVSQSGRKITDMERLRILSNSGRRKCLKMRLAEVMKTDTTMIEIGSTTLTNEGAFMHVVHLVAREQLTRQRMPSHRYIQHLYEEHKQEVNDAFLAHFELGRRFSVTMVELETAMDEAAPNGEQVASLLERYFDYVVEGEASKSYEQRRSEIETVMERLRPQPGDMEESVMKRTVELSPLDLNTGPSKDIHKDSMRLLREEPNPMTTAITLSQSASMLGRKYRKVHTVGDT